MEIERIYYDNTVKEYVLYFSNSQEINIIEDTLYFFNLYKGKTLVDFTVEDIINKNNFYIALNIALRFLRNMKTSKEVELKLSKENISTHTIKEVLIYLGEKELVDDLNYSKLYVHDKLKINKFGKNKIKYNLMKKGIDSSIIDMALSELDTEEEYDNAVYFAEKKINSFSRDELNKKPKLIRHLLNKGYEYSLVDKVVRKLMPWKNIMYIY